MYYGTPVPCDVQTQLNTNVEDCSTDHNPNPNPDHISNQNLSNDEDSLITHNLPSILFDYEILDEIESFTTASESSLNIKDNLDSNSTFDDGDGERNINVKCLKTLKLL